MISEELGVNIETVDVRTYLLTYLLDREYPVELGNLKSCNFPNVYCSVVQTIWDLIKQYANFCGINNWNFIKLTT